MGKLTANEVKAALNRPGTYQDGDGLFLKVDRRGGASWKVRVQHCGIRRDYAVGSARLVSLAEARAEASRLRHQIRVEGRDPATEKRKAKAAAVTFREAAEAFCNLRHPESNASGRADARFAMLKTYAFPKLGDRPVGDIEAADIVLVLQSVWTTKPETGRRLRQRICATLDYAHTQGWRATEAPARSLAAGRGLPRQPPRDTHRLAMPYADVPSYLVRLRERFSFGRLALEFLILTAARSQEVREATWDEFDTQAGLWTVPASRMKARRVHVVALSQAALAVLAKAKTMRVAGTDLVFPGSSLKRPMSNMTLLKVLRDAEEPFHVHGFRSSFRDWVSEETHYPGEVAEAALAHVIANKVEAAYRRGDLLEKRRGMMEAWGAFCDDDHCTVVSLIARG